MCACMKLRAEGLHLLQCMQAKGSMQDYAVTGVCLKRDCQINTVHDGGPWGTVGYPSSIAAYTALKHTTVQRCIFCVLTEPYFSSSEARRRMASGTAILNTLPAVMATAVILGLLPCLKATRRHPYRADCRSAPRQCWQARLQAPALPLEAEISEAVMVLLLLFVVRCIPANALHRLHHSCFQ